MKINPNKDAASTRIPYFFCGHCHANRDAADPGDVYPVCIECGRRLELRWMEMPSGGFATPVAPPDDRPEEAAPFLQEPFRQRKLADKTGAASTLALDALTLLVTDFEEGIANPNLYHALLHGSFNRFTRALVHEMIIGQLPWRKAVAELSKDFCARYASQLEEFQRWAENPAASAVPAFIEPEPTTHHEPLKTPSPPGTFTESDHET